MEITFARPAEAMAGIVWIVCAADDVGSAEEHHYIQSKVKEMDVFAEMTPNEFSSILAATRTKLFSALPNNGFCLSQLGAEVVINAANGVLDPVQKRAACEMAAELAASDKIVGSEQLILDTLRKTFKI